MKKFNPNDRVRRTNFRSNPASSPPEAANGSAEIPTLPRGCLGTVKAIREETTLAAKESKEKSIMIHVLWDSGTLSYLGPEGLEVVE